MIQFVDPTNVQPYLKMALTGPAGSGKTYTALKISQTLSPSGKIAVLDTEGQSASKYRKEFSYKVAPLDEYHPNNFIDAIDAAEKAGFEVLIIDSLSHEWFGQSGALDLADRATLKSKSGNSYFAWRDVTPLHRQLLEKILQSKIHVIATMRTKTAYVVEDRGGKQAPKEVGLEPIQRDGVKYEFDVVGELDLDNTMVIRKSRCRALRETNDGVFPKPGAEVAKILIAWLSDLTSDIEGYTEQTQSPAAKTEAPKKTRTAPPQPKADQEHTPKTPQPPAPAPTAASRETCSPEILKILDAIPRFMKQRQAESVEDATEYAHLLICKHLNLGSVYEATDQNALRSVLRGKVIPELEEKGYLKKEEKDAA